MYERDLIKTSSFRCAQNEPFFHHKTFSMFVLLTYIRVDNRYYFSTNRVRLITGRQQ
jgi:hypothetical protein